MLLPTLFYLTVLEFLLPLLAVVGFTLRVACFLSSGHGLMHQHSRARRTRAVRLLVAVLVVFTLCFTPFHVRQVLVFFRVKVRGAGQVLAYHVTVTLSSLNSCLDPVVYCFVTDSFRRAWRSRTRGGAREAGHTSGGEGETNFGNKYSSTALAIAHSVVALSFTRPPISVVNMEQSI